MPVLKNVAEKRRSLGSILGQSARIQRQEIYWNLEGVTVAGAYLVCKVEAMPGR